MPYPILTKKPLERVQIDLIQVPKLMSLEICYLMTCKDHFSRYAAVYLLSDKSSKSTSECLENLINTWGKPDIIQTDNGTEFLGSFDTTLKTFQIKHIRGRPYHPQSQGSIEAFNRHIKNRINQMLASNPDTFQLKNAVENFLKMYNENTKHSATLMIPSQLFREQNQRILSGKRWN
jgi:transposase InsO family protein